MSLGLDCFLLPFPFFLFLTSCTSLHVHKIFKLITHFNTNTVNWVRVKHDPKSANKITPQILNTHPIQRRNILHTCKDLYSSAVGDSKMKLINQYAHFIPFSWCLMHPMLIPYPQTPKLYNTRNFCIVWFIITINNYKYQKLTTIWQQTRTAHEWLASPWWRSPLPSTMLVAL